MGFEQTVAFIALFWLLGAFGVMTRMLRRGRDLSEALAARHPEAYETLGSPRPGYLASLRRNRFAQYVGRRGYEDLPDGALSAEFEAYRKAEARVVVSILASGAILAAVAALVSRAA